jgi:catechol 2,3-dioxygenase-like lactoylglutathione lyase family enzyme
MLDKATVTANIPAADLARARAFYADKLGLIPSHEMDGIVLVYRTATGSAFSIYQTEYAGQAGHTIAQWHVADVDAVVRGLKAKSVVFEHYDMPGVDWNDDVASMGDMGKAAWFKDSENNILCIDDGFPGERVSDDQSSR